MSTREKCIMLLDELPDSKLGYVLAYIQGLSAAEEAADDEYCEELYREYEASSDRGETMSFDEVAGVIIP